MTAPQEALLKKLHAKGFCTAQGHPTTKLGWIHLDVDQIILLYNGMNRGLQNSYRFAGRTPLTGECAQASLRGRPRGRLGLFGSGKGCLRGRPRGRFGSV
jgi:hypothetical protein